MEDHRNDDRSAGGAVEPVNRVAAAKQRLQTPPEPAVERYELRDPFAEVTYNTRTFDEMSARADKLGAVRFHAIGQDGKRTPVVKVEGAWQRADALDSERRQAKDREQSGVTAAASLEARRTEGRLAQMETEAERTARVERIEVALAERYLIKRVGVGQTEYRYRGDTTRVAFMESVFKLSTDNNSPSVARSMVDVAETRSWRALRISGNEDFRRMVWLEASLRGVRTLGYEPQHADAQLLRRERESRQVNRIEPAADPDSGERGTTKQSARGGSGRKAVLVALEAVLVANRVPETQREAVMSAAAETLARRTRNGQTHKVKVFDKSTSAGTPQQALRQPAPEHHQVRDRASRVR